MAKAEAKKKPNGNDELLKQLEALLGGGQRPATIADAVRDFPVELRGIAPAGLPYSAWQLLEHMRLALDDILNFSAPPTGGYQELPWPDAYWPKENAPASPAAWDRSIAAVEKDLERFKALLAKPNADLYKPFRWGTDRKQIGRASCR